MLRRTLKGAARLANRLLHLRDYHVTRHSHLRELERIVRDCQHEIESHQAMQLAAENDAAWLRRELARIRCQEREATAAADDLARVERIAADDAQHRSSAAACLRSAA
ncbi:MAG TPA: hypothetical protein VND64_03300 [Pirellulales bacterium]|nr:hypothetical protein [Pirellulales bacterium]